MASRFWNYTAERQGGVPSDTEKHVPPQAREIQKNMFLPKPAFHPTPEGHILGLGHVGGVWIVRPIEDKALYLLDNLYAAKPSGD